MNPLYQFKITLTLQAPFLTKSTSPASFGLDAAIARDFKTGKPIIPGTLIEGKLRESLIQLGEGELANKYFGEPTGEDSGAENSPSRGTLQIGDLTLDGTVQEDQSKPSPTMSRAAIDGVLGSAKGEMLREIEMPFPAGTKVNLIGRGTLFCKNDDAAKEAAVRIHLGLSWLVQVGALASTGFGRILKVEVSHEKVEADAESMEKTVRALDLAITPLGPLCIARPKIGDNLFESEDIMPGNMLAGAIMQTADRMGLASESFKTHFSTIRFFHAFPTAGETRPRALPQSTVAVGKKRYDVSKHRDPVLIRNEDNAFAAPQFPVDWKDHGEALSDHGWAFPARELRVRTAIDSTKRTADRGEGSEGGKLFAWEMIHPFAREDSGTKDIVWRSRIDLSGVPEEHRVSFLSILAEILPRLSFVSKTKARCRVEVRESEPDTFADLADGETLSLVLQTPALIADPRFQKIDGVRPHGSLSPEEMEKCYRAAWSEISGESLQLDHHFSRQFLAGGNYLAHRFQQLGKNGACYDPWLLTDAGSVFVFTIQNAGKAKEKLDHWLSAGLDLPPWARDRFGEAWNRNPYRPGNGFGEVSVHDPKYPSPAENDYEAVYPPSSDQSSFSA